MAGSPSLGGALVTISLLLFSFGTLVLCRGPNSLEGASGSFTVLNLKVFEPRGPDEPMPPKGNGFLLASFTVQDSVTDTKNATCMLSVNLGIENASGDLLNSSSTCRPPSYSVGLRAPEVEKELFLSLSHAVKDTTGDAPAYERLGELRVPRLIPEDRYVAESCEKKATGASYIRWQTTCHIPNTFHVPVRGTRPAAALEVNDPIRARTDGDATAVTASTHASGPASPRVTQVAARSVGPGSTVCFFCCPQRLAPGPQHPVRPASHARFPRSNASCVGAPRVSQLPPALPVAIACRRRRPRPRRARAHGACSLAQRTAFMKDHATDSGRGAASPVFQVIVLGSGGGPNEENVTGFLVRSTATRWSRSSLLAVDAGTHLAAITRILDERLPLRPDEDTPRKAGTGKAKVKPRPSNGSSSPAEARTPLRRGRAGAVAVATPDAAARPA
ncbi:MAG: 3',5'-cyclic-nucleotide phosphodiesterase pde1, partial [Thelocarpon impressellum]